MIIAGLKVKYLERTVGRIAGEKVVSVTGVVRAICVAARAGTILMSARK